IAGDASLTAELTPRLSDPDGRVASSAAWAVGFLAAPEGREALIAAIPQSASPEPRAALLQALWRYADKPSNAAAAAHAADPDARAPPGALSARARRPQEGSLAILTEALEEGDPNSAALAARALGLLGKKESLEPLAAALDSAKPGLVTNSLVALEAVLEKNRGSTLSESRKDRVLALAGNANPNFSVPALVLLRQFVESDRQALRRVWAIASTGEGRRRNVALVSLVAALGEKANEALEKAAA